MNSSIAMMLARYSSDNAEAKKNAMKEIMQEIVLCGLSRAGFFKQAAFYGGTALRIFYGLDRFSEDLDFSLKEKDLSFDLKQYFPMLHKEVAAYGLRLDITEKEKSKESTIKSAFLKGNTKEHILMFYADQKLVADIIPTEQIKIKFEIDIDPPPYATFEHKYQLLPAPYEVQLYDAPSLFAGKLHAVLCRSWKNRVKGRDLYDYIFYLSKGISVNLPHLQARLIDSGALNKDSKFDSAILTEMLCQRFATIDYESARNDVYTFIKDKDSLNIWSQDFFQGITRQYLSYNIVE